MINNSISVVLLPFSLCRCTVHTDLVCCGGKFPLLIHPPKSTRTNALSRCMNSSYYYLMMTVGLLPHIYRMAMKTRAHTTQELECGFSLVQCAALTSVCLSVLCERIKCMTILEFHLESDICSRTHTHTFKVHIYISLFFMHRRTYYTRQ